jgi:hypothetical protein
MGQPQGVAPTVCYEPSPVGVDPVSVQPRTPPTQTLPTGQPQGVAPTRFGPLPVAPSPVGADPRVRPSTNATHTGAANGATTGGCPYAIWTVARCTITRRGGPLCPPNRERHPHRRRQSGNHGGLPLRDLDHRPLHHLRRGGPLCPHNHQRHPHSQRGNHRGLPLRFAMNHRPSGRTPVSAHSQMPHHRHPPTGQPRGLPLRDLDRCPLHHHP